MKFTASANGFITGIRFYKGVNNTGTHVGNLWSSIGTLLASATFTGETASGWQQVSFSSPVAITANTVYVASYFSPTGDFSVDRNYFATAGVSNPPLQALVNGGAGGANGVYMYGSTSQFPTSTYQSSNYWVDVVFTSQIQFTIWPSTAAPGGTVDTNETQPVELGVKFSSPMTGSMVGIRFYKGVNNTGTHVGNLWSSTGTLLASAIFTGETASGWQQVSFSNPVAITANTVYVASYFSPTGDFPVDRNYFATAGVSNPPLQALVNGGAGGANGVYMYGSASQFPTSTYQSSNYWVDVVFSPAQAPPPLAVTTTSLPGSTQGTAYSQTLTASGGTTPYSWSLATGSSLPAGLTLSAGGVISGTPTGTGTTSFTVKVTDSSSPAQSAQAALSITIATGTPPPNCPCTIWPNAAAPGGTVDTNQTQPVELGVKFTVGQNGSISGIRFYKGVNNTGTHVGHLWSNTGTLLASATFTGESVSGWQQVNFSNAVTIAANAVYVASYFSPTGDFSVDRNYFATAGVSNPPLQAPVNGGTAGANGVYAYGSTSQFPTSTYQSSNYWVDVVFSPAQAPPPLAVTTTSLPGSTQGTAYSQTLTASGGTTPYSWSLATGSSLPAGLTLSAGGVISGTPTGTGTTSFTVKVTDSSSPAQSAQTTLSIAVSPAPLAVTTTSLPGGTQGTAYSQTLTASGGTTPYSWSLVTGSSLPAGLTLSAGGVISGTPTGTGTTSFTVKVTDSSSPAQSAQAALSITIATGTPPPNCPCTVWPNTATPMQADTLETTPVELGVKFTSSVNGYITGIRFYKGASNTGTHVGNLWTSTGTLLMSATFTGETASGWQQVNFSNPVAITANTVYIASYFSPTGDFSVDRAYFTTTGVNNPPLQALINGGAAGTDGVYNYGNTSHFPTTSYQSSNYWVDVVFNTVGTGATQAVSISPKRGGTAVNQLLPLTATVVNDIGNAGVNWSVSAGGTLTLQTTSTASFSATAAGVYTITATSIANSSASANVTIGVTDLTGVATYHNNLSRDGTNTHEFTLTPTNVTPTSFAKLFACPIDAPAYAQPLWVPNLTINGARHNVIYVATEHNSIYAFDADNPACVNLWGGPKSLMLAGETFVSSGDVGIVDIYPDIGITGTPVIDLATQTLYVVSKSKNTSSTCSTNSTCHQRLHALSLIDGSEKFGGPANIDNTITVPGTGDGSSNGVLPFNSLTENQRPGLALVNGVVYIAWASHGDNDPYHGWVIGFNAGNLAAGPVAKWNSTPNTVSGFTNSRGGIWMAGGAPAVDAANNLYLQTGNGSFDANAGGSNYGDSTVKLSTASGLAVAGYFAPDDQAHLYAIDLDHGSGGAAILVDQPSGPVTHLLIGGGKEGLLFLLNRDSLGSYSSTANNVVQTVNIGQGIYGTSAFWNNNLYIAGSGGSLLQYAFNTTTGHFGSNPAHSSSALFNYPGSTPAVSSTGTSSNGIVWALDNSQFGTPCCANGPAILHAYDATNVSTELWNSTEGVGNGAGNAVKFTVPTVANGKVYIGTRSELDVYGLLPN